MRSRSRRPATHSNSTQERGSGNAISPTPTRSTDRRFAAITPASRTRPLAAAQPSTRLRAPRNRRRGSAAGADAERVASSRRGVDAEHGVEPRATNDTCRDLEVVLRAAPRVASAAEAAQPAREESAPRTARAVTAGETRPSTCAGGAAARAGRWLTSCLQRVDPGTHGAVVAELVEQRVGRPPTTSTRAPARPAGASSSPERARGADQRLDHLPQLVDSFAEERGAGAHPVDRTDRRSIARGAARARSRRRCGARDRARSPSALFTTSRSASSTMPRFTPWSSSPAPGPSSSTNRSTMPATATSDWPTPTVSTSTTSKPAGLAHEQRLARSAARRRRACHPTATGG